ncbi:hypothetical protein GCM10023197_26380 [Gordonia humi]
MRAQHHERLRDGQFVPYCREGMPKTPCDPVTGDGVSYLLRDDEAEPRTTD